MAYLSFISDEDLLKCIAKLYETYESCQHEYTVEDFYKNKVDPIKFHFDMVFNGISEDAYIKAEINRQVDKTISNAIGDFHQSLLGCIDGLTDLGVGNGCDLVNDDNTIFAELKNKHNTMNSSSSEATIQKLIATADAHPAATCYLIQIIAKKSTDELWSGSFNGKYYSHPRVRKISGDRFYALVTGIPDAFHQLCEALPQATADFLAQREGTNVASAESKSLYSQLHENVETNGITLLAQIMADNFDTYSGF